MTLLASFSVAGTGIKNAVMSNYQPTMPRRSANLSWCTAQEHALFGLMGQADTAATRTIVGVELEGCQPRVIVSDCKGVVKAIKPVRSGDDHPKGTETLGKELFLPYCLRLLLKTQQILE
eukprot:1704225-Amphidinium_carterae.1